MFCGKCGSFVPDEDLFCSKCGSKVNRSAASQPAGQPVAMPVQQAAAQAPAIPGAPSAQEALLEVICTAQNPSASVTIKTLNLGNIRIGPGGSAPISVPIGPVTIYYHVDRGPALTWVSSRHADYQKSLQFHPGERIVMQVNVGRNRTHTYFQSSQGYIIV